MFSTRFSTVAIVVALFSFLTLASHTGAVLDVEILDTLNYHINETGYVDDNLDRYNIF